ncbi:hypothetical protein ACQVP2_01570 [Methylobacterium aquaticum]|uniref:hypothetical protein n=1 Tax=Methylobacterium aquaticum TaxID=270351 RepID=UPI003D1741CF
MVGLVRAGCDPTDLAGEFESSAQAIRNHAIRNHAIRNHAIRNGVAEADQLEGRREAKPPAR